MITNEERFTIGPVSLDRLTMKAAVDKLLRLSQNGVSHPLRVMASNAQFLHIARDNPRFANLANTADLNVADGMSFIFASRLLGKPFPERITGIDLMLKICEEGAKIGKSIFLLGGKIGAAEKTAKILADRFPGLRIAGVCRPPIGSEFEEETVTRIRSQIREAKPDFLFVCFGAPRQEYWIQQYGSDLPVSIVMGNGAAFDVVSGSFSRPPGWIQDLGFEWLYRVVKEPKRLWRRYLTGNAVFLAELWLTWSDREGSKIKWLFKRLRRNLN